MPQPISKWNFSFWGGGKTRVPWRKWQIRELTSNSSNMDFNLEHNTGRRLLYVQQQRHLYSPCMAQWRLMYFTKHFILPPPVTKLSKAPLLMIRYQTQNAAWIVSVSFCILSRRNLVINSKQEFIDKLFQFKLAPTGRNFRLNDPCESSRLFGKTTAILPAFYGEKLNIAPQVRLRRRRLFSTPTNQYSSR